MHATDMEFGIGIGIGEARRLSTARLKRSCYVLDVFIALEEDNRKCEGITRRCEFGYMEYGTVCDGSGVALKVKHTSTVSHSSFQSKVSFELLFLFFCEVFCCVFVETATSSAYIMSGSSKRAKT